MRYLGLRRQSFLALTMLAAASPVIAGETGKGYPVQGKIIATALNQVPRQQTHTGPNGAVYSSRVIVVTRTYTVQTQDKTYVLDCGKHPHIFSSTPGECGGDKKLQAGDELRFRLEKKRRGLRHPKPPIQTRNRSYMF